jgi:hypothetical protein
VDKLLEVCSVPLIAIAMIHKFARCQLEVERSRVLGAVQEVAAAVVVKDA